MGQDDPFNLQRFVAAQDGMFERVRAELRAGRKRSHWIWFVFPQIEGLGFSPTAQFYALSSLDEARSFLAHPVLGPRLRECVDLVNRIESRSLFEIFGDPDDKKFRSSMTLFERAAPDEKRFAQALDKYCAGARDPLTLQKLGL
ncbi:DUF1810 domain-containing protein [Rhodoblastus acidophilus]|uniref:DUF1810 domain-containing protein n=1 Tax=Candidatus Rhodoblastus alkanivorans TaxID=2954117 RepID=A0ABS9ZBR0_9HYPH|nr:DUF1810 domain-containing protein [Candidatus Rhodoblastus alkanivorans]MCI4679370.1 DUF1810 domain-containing protein [Candidatus Rhodoblastus alkanivorans]MCI4684846.1 DUF1810 domain-containing protein [Candidatus Rhodoblastus alkanivorans]MDI4642170.1 DUF1810 domain-containing protein [Rhodoblastus acidophilus]